MVEAGANEMPEDDAARGARARARRDRQALRGAGGAPRAGRQAEVARPGRSPTSSRAAHGRRDPRADRRPTACREAGSIVEELCDELCPPLTMDSTEDDITRQHQVRASLDLLLDKQRLAAVEGPVREQFESDLTALTDAEQDSKELKSAKRQLLFERIIETVELPFPVGTPGRRGRGPRQGLAHEELRQAGRRGDLQGPRPPARSPSTSAGRTVAAPRRSARSSARSASPRARTARASSRAARRRS